MEWYTNLDHREKARRCVQRRQLVSVMNDTKWEEFRRAMTQEMPFPPAYRLKTIYDGEDTRPLREGEIWYWGDYSWECFAGWYYYTIEWVRWSPGTTPGRGAVWCIKRSCTTGKSSS